VKTVHQNKKQARIQRGRASHRRGWLAEYQALVHLLAKGYWPCAMRFRAKKGEIDLIMRRGNLFVAVEVKARPDALLGHEAMTAQDWQRRAAAMADFMRRHKYKNCSVRFDLVIVNPYFQTHHVESAWQPEFSAF
jgi:putative endonuclease